MRRFISVGSVVCALLPLLIACSDAGKQTPALTESDAPVDIDVRVMTFNIEWGGTHVSFDNIVEAIRRSRADIVGIQEAEGNLERLAAALDWQYDRRNYVISRFPLLDPPGADGLYVLAEVRPDYVVAIANLHLPSDPYGPDLVRDGAPLDDVLANEHAVRMPALQRYLNGLPEIVAEGIPLFVTGDFNSPTHTDWTVAMVGKRPFLNYAVEWPVSLAMQDAGFKDAWRAVLPDAALKPGLTWWAGRPPLDAYAPGENDAQDRIDLIWYAGRGTPLSAQLVGEEGGPDVEISVSPWPSDHRAVVTTFAVEPAPLPVLITTDRRVYREGDDVRVTYNFADETSAGVSLLDVDDDRAIEIKQLTDARGQFELRSLSAGHYLARAMVSEVSLEREFWIMRRDTTPAIELHGNRFGMDDPIVLSWQDAPGNRNDYIAIYAAESGHNVEDMLAYAYLAARPEGSMPLSALVVNEGWSLSHGTHALSPGTYLLRLLKDDGYEVLAESQLFEIR